MHLKSLQINGFKSFGKKSELLFNTPITSIVGPNGSGKSNVAEAFRFVLGEQSIKSMRGKRGEDLIFNGSNDAGRSNRASVSLTFHNQNRLLNIDFDEVTIERVVFRDGANEYFINGSKVRLKDVSELLAGAHIGSTGHHIISQGEADRILHANPKEKREMIEDALGIKIYQWRIEESDKKLAKTLENMKQVESLRKEIGPHLKYLKKQVEKLEKAREVKQELVSLSRDYFKREELYILHAKARFNESKVGPEAELKGIEAKLLDLRRMVEGGLKDKETPPEILSLESKLHQSRDKKDDLMHNLGKIEGEISYLEKAKKKEEETTREEGNKMVPLREVESVFQNVIANLDQASTDISIESIKKAISKVKDFFGSFVLRFKEAHSNAEQEFDKELKDLSEKKRSLEYALGHAKEEEKTLLSHYEEKRQELEREKDDTREAEKEIFKVIARQNEVHATLDRIKFEEKQVAYDEETMLADMNEISYMAGIDAVQTRDVVMEYIHEERNLQHKRKSDIVRLKIRLEEMGVGGGDDIIKECTETEQRDMFLLSELEDLVKASDDLHKMIAELTEKLNSEFKEGVSKINSAFNEFFAMMFGGGHAKLSLIKSERRKRKNEEGEEILEDNDEEGEEGLDIEVSLPHKKIKGLMMLSGGERALTSIALLFAISQVNPPPFIILDETDAALDEANSRKYGDMVENLSKHSQLIVITHNRETMSRAGVLYGVTMGKDAISKLLSISFAEAEVVAK